MNFKACAVMTVATLAMAAAKTACDVAPKHPETQEIPGDFEIEPMTIEEFEKLQDRLRKEIEAELRKELEAVTESPPVPSEAVGGVILSTPTASGNCATGQCGVQYSRQYVPAKTPVQSQPRRFRLRFWR